MHFEGRNIKHQCSLTESQIDQNVLECELLREPFLSLETSVGYKMKVIQGIKFPTLG